MNFSPCIRFLWIQVQRHKTEGKGVDGGCCGGGLETEFVLFSFTLLFKLSKGWYRSSWGGAGLIDHFKAAEAYYRQTV
jgi:hypothetical protein